MGRRRDALRYPTTSADRVDVGEDGWVVSGVPFDATASSRPGAAEGPRAIRQASLVFSSYLTSLGQWRMLDTRTGQVFRYRAPQVADAGDLHVYPTDTVRTFQAVAAESRRLSQSAPRLIFLNGDHSCTFPSFAGFRAGRLDAARGVWGSSTSTTTSTSATGARCTGPCTTAPTPAGSARSLRCARRTWPSSVSAT